MLAASVVPLVPPRAAWHLARHKPSSGVRRCVLTWLALMLIQFWYSSTRCSTLLAASSWGNYDISHKWLLCKWFQSETQSVPPTGLHLQDPSFRVVNSVTYLRDCDIKDACFDGCDSAWISSVLDHCLVKVDAPCSSLPAKHFTSQLADIIMVYETYKALNGPRGQARLPYRLATTSSLL